MNRYLMDKARRRDRARGQYSRSEPSTRVYDRNMYDPRMMNYGMPMYDGHYRREEKPIEFYGYGMGAMMKPDYARNYDYASENEEREYKEHLNRWIERMKAHDKYGMTKDQVIQYARNLNVKFDNYNEDEFYAMYLSSATDYEDVTNDPTIFIRMAKGFLEDKDVARRGSDKVCAYLYSIVLGEDE